MRRVGLEPTTSHPPSKMVRLQPPSERPRSVLLIENHPMVAQSLQALLRSIDPSLFIFEPCTTLAAGLRGLSAQPTYVFVDLNLEDSSGLGTLTELLNIMRARSPRSIVSVFSGDDQPAKIRAVLRAGARGYITKNLGVVELGEAVRTFITEKQYIPNIPLAADDDVTGIAHEVLKCFAKGMTNEETAKYLRCTTDNVKYHQNRVAAKFKLDKSTRINLVEEARRRGYLD